MGDDRGASTPEYVGVVLLVAAVVGAMHPVKGLEGLRPVRRRAAALLVALAVVASAACTDDDEARGDGDGLDLERFEDDRLAFEHPAGWDVEAEERGEQQVRVEDRRAGEDHAEALILAVWPTLHSHDLDGAIGFFGRDEDEPEVSDLEGRDIEVPGATEAVLHTMVTTDAAPGEDIPYRFWTVFAMGEVDRVVVVTVAVAEGADTDAEEVADAVLDSLELSPSWG